ncbi:DNA primase [Myxococcota bacterium]
MAFAAFAVWVWAVIGQDTIERVRDQTDLLALVRETVKLERAGRSYRGLCPFHKEKTPSFHVQPERGFFHCFGCGAHGDAISYVEQVEGLGFMDAVRRLAERLGIEVAEVLGEPERRQQATLRRRHQELYDVGQAAASYFERMLREHPMAGCARVELERRGLASDSPTDERADALQAFRVGYAPLSWDGLSQHLQQLGLGHAGEAVGLLQPRRSGPGHYDRFRHRLMFAVVDVQGRVVAFSGRALDPPSPDQLRHLGQGEANLGTLSDTTAKYINSPESAIYRKREAVFGIYQARLAIRETGEALLVEGNFDVLSLYSRGIRYVVAPLGTAFSVDQGRLIKRFAPTVTFLFDGDRAGRAATIKARSACREAGLFARVASLPDGMDPDEYVRSKGSEGLRRVLQAARGMLEHLIDVAVEEARRAPDLETRAARLKEVAELLGAEGDPAVRAMAREYADRLASELGVQGVESFGALSEAVHRSVGIHLAKVAGGSSVRPEPPWRARSADRSDEVPRRILGALLDYPELLGIEEVVSGLDIMEGDVAAAIAIVRQSWEESGRASASAVGRRFREQVLAKVAQPIHAFAAARLAAPQYNSAEDARLELLDNVSKLHRLALKPQRPQVVAGLRRAAATGDVLEEDALLLAHQNRLLGELRRVLSKRDQNTPVKR